MSSVLIVVGDEDLRCALVELVRDHGCEVTAVSDGEAALEILHSQVLPGLVLLDAQLPAVAGSSVLAAIRSDPRLASLRVVSMSTDLCVQPEPAAAHVRLPDQEPELATILHDLCSQ
jgi:CheY-like chemotaxis protein